MRNSSRLLLAIAKCLPRGYWPLIKYAAANDSALQDYPLHLPNVGVPIRADMRESVYVTLFKCGNIPHQSGFDKVCEHVIRPGEMVFDVGANIGYTTARFARIVGADGCVIAFEPSPSTFRLLARSLGHLSNVVLFPFGLSSSSGSSDLYVPDSLDTASIAPIEGIKPISIEVSTLDSIYKEYGIPSFLKVDVEGFEVEVFRGGTAMFHRNDRPIVLFEALTKGCLSDSCRALDFMTKGSYQYWRIRNDGAVVPILHDGTSDYIAVPEWAVERIAPLAGS